MSAAYGPQLPTPADVEAAEAELAARQSDVAAICDQVGQPSSAAWPQRLYDAQTRRWQAAQAADSARYLNWAREEDASSPDAYRARIESGAQAYRPAPEMEAGQ